MQQKQRVSFKTKQDYLIAFSIDNLGRTTTAKELKEKCLEERKDLEENFRLFFLGKELADNEAKLFDFKIGDRSVIQLLPPKKLQIEENTDGPLEPEEIVAYSTIYSLKKNAFVSSLDPQKIEERRYIL